jgi:hypothetical protein
MTDVLRCEGPVHQLHPQEELSHTEGLIDASAAIMCKHGVSVDLIRALGHDISRGRLPRHARARLKIDACPTSTRRSSTAPPWTSMRSLPLLHQSPQRPQLTGQAVNDPTVDCAGFLGRWP